MIRSGALAPSWFLRFGAALCVAPLAIFIFGLPPFHLGIWLQTESVVLAVIGIACLQAAWLTTGLYKGWLTAHYLHHLLWWCLHLWVVWQIAMLPFAESWWRSWFGYPAHGVGVVWHVALWLTMLVVFALWQHLRIRQALFLAAFSLLIIQVLLFVVSDEHTNMFPATIPTYLAFVAGWLWIGYATHKETLRFRDLLLVGAIVMGAVYFSESRAALLFIIPALLVSYIAKECAKVRFFQQPPLLFRKIVAAGVIVVGFSWVAISQQPSMFPDKRGSLAIRAAMHEVALQTLADEPARLITGKGWGGFHSDGFRYALTTGTYLYKEGEFSPYAPLYENPAFHSHNQALEALLSLGLMGFVLWGLLPAIVIMTIPARYFWNVVPMLSGMVCMAYLWFDFPHQLAYVAIAWAGIASVCCSNSKVRNLSARQSSVIMFAAFVVMAVSAWGQYGAMAYGRTLFKDAFNAPHATYTDAMINQDLVRGGDRLAFVTRHYLLGFPPSLDTLTENEKVWHAYFVGAAQQLAVHPSSSLPYGAIVIQFYDALHEAEGKIPAMWVDLALELGLRAPTRDDLAVKLLIVVDKSAVLSTKEKQAIYKKFLQIAPYHRPAQWFHIKRSATIDRAALFNLHSSGLYDISPITQRQLNHLLEP